MKFILSFRQKLILLSLTIALLPNNALFSQGKGNFQYDYTGDQSNFIINYDRRQSETRSERVKIALEVSGFSLTINVVVTFVTAFKHAFGVLLSTILVIVMV